MQNLAMKWRKPAGGVDGDDYSLPTRDDSRPIDTNGDFLLADLLFFPFEFGFEFIIKIKTIYFSCLDQLVVYVCRARRFGPVP